MNKILIGILSITAGLIFILFSNNTPNLNVNNKVNSITQNINNNTREVISLEKAKEIALKHANLANDKVSFIKANQEFDDGIEKYDIEFYHNNKEYDYEINAINGNIISYDYDIEYCNNINKNITSTQNNISIEKAKEIALKHANLANDKVSFIKANQEFDDGIEKYDIEFYHNNKEYDYEINAINGNIISYDYDIEYCNNINKNITSTQNNISIEKAKEIALKHANLANDKVSFIKANQEFDDGIEKYDIEFYHNSKEYNYEINANNGKIVSYEFE